VSSVAIAGFFSESRLRLLDSFMPYRNEGMSEVYGVYGVLAR
jgi:hypothetical protein